MKNLFAKILCVGLIAACAGSLSISASAQETNTATADSGAKAKAKAKAKPTHTPFKGIVASVDKSAKTITLKGARKQTLQITSQTKISKDGKPATSDDLAAGVSVRGSTRQTVDGKLEAVSIKIVTPVSATEKPVTPSAPVPAAPAPTTPVTPPAAK